MIGTFYTVVFMDGKRLKLAARDVQLAQGDGIWVQRGTQWTLHPWHRIKEFSPHNN